MATISELKIRRDKLLERLESLQKRVTHGDKTVEYDLRSSTQRSGSSGSRNHSDW